MMVPSYFEANVAAAIEEAKRAMLAAGRNGETFVYISDLHWETNEKHSPALVKAVTGALSIENTFFGGDTFNGGTQEKVIGIMNDIRQQFTEASPHFLAVYGNHDDNHLDGGTVFTQDVFYPLMQKHADDYVTYEAPCYYYMDSEATKTRFIILDSGTGTPSTASAQIAWLQKITGNAPEGWHFIVFVHKIFGPGPGGAFNDPSTWEMSPFATDVCAVLDAVNAAGKMAENAAGNDAGDAAGNATGNTVGNAVGSVVGNVAGKAAVNAAANAAGGKKVEAIFGGHCHIDYNGQTDGGIPIVMIDCDTRLSVSGNLQEAGTIGEQCLDIVTVNYAAGEIHCTRIGRGKSRMIAY